MRSQEIAFVTCAPLSVLVPRRRAAAVGLVAKTVAELRARMQAVRRRRGGRADAAEDVRDREKTEVSVRQSVLFDCSLYY